MEKSLFLKYICRQLIGFSDPSFVQYDQSTIAISRPKYLPLIQLQAVNSWDGGIVPKYSINSSVDGDWDPLTDDWKDTMKVSFVETENICKINCTKTIHNLPNKYILNSDQLVPSTVIWTNCN